MSAGEEMPDQSTWPEGVTPITLDQLVRLGVGRDDQLHWDGRPVVTRRRLDLTLWQKIGAVLVTITVMAGGIGGLVQGVDAGHNFGCKVHWWTEGCTK
jgi:hypothetical protein